LLYTRLTKGRGWAEGVGGELERSTCEAALTTSTITNGCKRREPSKPKKKQQHKNGVQREKLGKAEKRTKKQNKIHISTQPQAFPLLF
jgi:hypothetical protein